MEPQFFVNADINMLPSYDEALVQNAFDYIVNDSKIEFDYPQGGCQQRAHLMSLILLNTFNIQHCKLWLFAPAAFTLNDYRTLFINDKNDYTETDCIEWNFHVAPIIKMNTENGLQQVIIDPSLNKLKLLNLTEFFQSIGNSNISRYTFLLPDKYFFNTSIVDGNTTNVFDGSFIDFDACDKDDLTMEKGLAENDMAMKIYYKHVQPLLQTNKEVEKLNDLKAIFGNATSVDLLFSQNISGKSANTTQRFVQTHYPELMQEARNIFYERLNYWTKFTASLFKAS